MAGQVLGRAAVYDGKNAVQTQSYGAEARGSAARSDVIISTGRIGFPMVRRCDILVAMSQEALNKHLKCLRRGGVLLIDEDLVREVPPVEARVFRVPATRVAENELGLRIYANMVMLGALASITNVVSEGALRKAIEDTVPPETKTPNLKGFERGLQLFRGRPEPAGRE